MPTATKVKPFEFYSRGRGERLVRRPKLTTYNALGQEMVIQQSLVYDFAPAGRLTIRPGQDKLADGPAGADGEPTERDAAAWLLAHPQFNQRFWLEGREPDRLLPTEDDFLTIVQDGVAALDAEPIRAALDAEEDTHKRPLLIAQAERALDTIERMQAVQAEGTPLP